MRTKEDVMHLLDRLHSDNVTKEDNDNWFALVSRFKHDWIYLDEIAEYHSTSSKEKVEELLPFIEQKLKEHKEPLFSALEKSEGS